MPPVFLHKTDLFAGRGAPPLRPIGLTKKFRLHLVFAYCIIVISQFVIYKLFTFTY
jgi:hypothetical protein